ncbi:MAG: cytochrome c biogenesis protein CcsA [bacterium]|nr:cytochrome c biogenesis protein CcsA [bacterium]
MESFWINIAKTGIGNIFIVFSLIASIAVIVLSVLHSTTGSGSSFRSAYRGFYFTSSVLITLSMILLFAAFLGFRFEYVYVYENSSRDLHLLYLIAGVWAGKSGSFLLWAFLLNIFGIFVLRAKDSNENILLTVITVTQLFILIILLIDSPFKLMWDEYKNVAKGFVPNDGAGLNPILIDPWMVVHPPVLFLGYASASIPFAYAIAALIRKEYSQWIVSAYKWIHFSMVTLGIGIFLGGYWAYKVLGWGGFWGWDPVENSSLIPWLIVAALAHGVVIQKRKKAMVGTNISLALAYFILVFVSTFLTRSGVLSDFSVHSFAADTIMTITLLLFCIFFILTAVIIFAIRYRRSASNPLSNRIFTWENLTTYGILSLILFSGIILLGTLMPIITGLLLKNPVKVGQGYYSNISLLFGILIPGFLIAATIAITGNKIKTPSTIISLAFSFAFSIFFNSFYPFSAIAHIFIPIAFFVFLQSLLDLFIFKTSPILASRISHMGVAILIIGVITSTYFTSSSKDKIYKDMENNIGPVNLTFKGLTKKKKSTLLFSVRKWGNTQNAEIDYYFSEKLKGMYKKPYVEQFFWGDLYIIPQSFESGQNSASESLVLEKGKTAKSGNLSIKFIQFSTEGMTSESPSIFANLLINNKKVSPGVTVLANGHRRYIDKKIPGTERTIGLHNFDLSKKSVSLSMSPGKNAMIMPDSLIIDISKKPFIWLVWLGTLLITAGGIIALTRKSPRSSSGSSVA